MNLFFSSCRQSRIMDRGRARGVFPFSLHHEKNLIASNRLYNSLVLFFLQNVLIFFLIFLWFSFFLPGNTRRWMFLYLLCSMLLLFGFCFLIRQGNPSLWRRRLRKSVRPLPAVTAGMNLMTRNQSPLIATNRRIPSTTMPTSINLPFFVSVSANSLIECE